MSGFRPHSNDMAGRKPRIKQALEENSMTTITDEMMRERIAQTKSYTVVILRKTTKYGEPGTDTNNLGAWKTKFPASRRRTAPHCLSSER